MLRMSWMEKIIKNILDGNIVKNSMDGEKC